jgi:type III pantothenate kinase
VILELDLGNTRVKWRVLDKRLSVLRRGRGVVEEWLRHGVPAEWAALSVQRIRAASVLSAQTEVSLAALILKTMNLKVEFARSVGTSSGVSNAYAEPQKLGVDRWLALLAAYKIANAPALVADIGSALTVDVVDRGGRHRGGYIIPGPRLMQNALLRDTERVRFPEIPVLTDVSFGDGTAACVAGGIAAAQVGAVLVALQRAEALLQDKVKIFVTGGWGGELGERLIEMGRPDFLLIPELVLDGLRWASP